MQRRRVALLLVGSAVAGSITGAVASAATPLMAPAADSVVDVSSMTGRGEPLIIVVGGTYGSRTEAEKALDSMAFGDMQGFYIDSSDNYTVTGYYEQTSPDAIVADCGVLPDPGDCPPRGEILANQAVELRHHDIDAVGAFLASSAAGQCDEPDLPPCIARRLSTLVDGPEYALTGGRFLLLSAFRTLRGAEEFAELARDRGAEIVAIRVVKTGGPYVGLGQEAHPDGVSGPLLVLLADPAKYQK